MNKLIYRFVATKTKKKKRNPTVFRHGMHPQGIPRKKRLLRSLCYRNRISKIPGESLSRVTQGKQRNAIFVTQTRCLLYWQYA